MRCLACGYEGPYNSKGHPWGGEITSSSPKWCRGRRNRPGSRKEYEFVIDAFRPFGQLKTTEESK